MVMEECGSVRANAGRFAPAAAAVDVAGGVKLVPHILLLAWHIL
jgi:hypothetical protein